MDGSFQDVGHRRAAMAGRKQFDVDEALEHAMVAFWEHGYAEASVDVLGRATGLGRGSLYGTFGGKDALFRRSLAHYSDTYGERYEAALAANPDDPVAAVSAFFDVVLARIADPDLPNGCLIAQSAAQAPTLTDESSAVVGTLLARQRERVGAALAAGGVPDERVAELAVFVVAVNQSLAVMSRAGVSMEDLRSITRTASEAVERATVG
jgi:AcrR family transcriptional regulator